MESTVGTNWNNLSYTLPIIVISILIFINQSRILNLMLLGDEVTVTLCKNLHVYRQLYLLLSSLIVNFAVYTAGMINFVGIIVHLLFKVQKYYCFDRKDKKSDVRNYKFDGKNFKLLILYILILMLNSYFYKKNNTHYLYIKNIR